MVLSMIMNHNGFVYDYEFFLNLKKYVDSKVGKK